MTNEGMNRAYWVIIKLARLIGELSPMTVLTICQDLGMAHDDTHAAIWHANADGAIDFTSGWKIKATHIEPVTKPHVHQPDGKDAGAHPNDPYFCDCGAEIVRGWVVK